MFICQKFVCISLILSAQWLCAREVTDTLLSTKNDRIIITYSIAQDNDNITIKFLNARKKLGRIFAAKYKLNEVVAMFFDRKGNFHNIQLAGIDTKPFMVPANMRYSDSQDGYFFLDDQPSITMSIKSGMIPSVSIPIYLAHYDKKSHYTIFSNCGQLTIAPPSHRTVSSVSNNRSPVTTRTVSQTFTTTEEELKSTFSEEDEANILIRKITELLPEQDTYPFSDELQQAISSLRDRSYRITNADLSRRINTVLDDCKQKANELKSRSQAAELAAQEATERRAAVAEAKEHARQDSIAAVQQQQIEKDKKRNIFMIIGGIVLAVLAFLGNQMFQHFRNIRNQKSIMDMQQQAVKRAENEAKRRAQSIARNQVHKTESQIRNKIRKQTRNAIDGGFSKVKTGKINKQIKI